jgi:circadian clock protein KaiC
MHKLIEQFKPAVVIVDPVSNMRAAGTLEESTNMLIRLVDYLRQKGILGFLISLNNSSQCLEATDEGLSSIVDSWLLLRDVEVNGERNRLLYILKSRGMAHSNQVREFLITSRGIRLEDAYLGHQGVITGTARANLEAREALEAQEAKQELARKMLLLEHRRKTGQAQMEALRAEMLADEEEYARAVAQERARIDLLEKARAAVATRRGVSHKQAVVE